MHAGMLSSDAGILAMAPVEVDSPDAPPGRHVHRRGTQPPSTFYALTPRPGLC